ncbi:RNA polymerase I-specific transcription initiation factor RRN3 [Xylona heveae TC161]|uniref:RNA polymerase I-specific transcription initiation factor RRN3 n=1 Tax=Xylona heveae (strain CBS 132557 / TC161) TaxID=1328760 RepID=A0A165JBS3_XYLHT|nr:RNA polymerase I-specific transcription initiation factor RRN3 [Xylona heveae TC161]KZF26023.1 RNA polymerase I-specific transcription initiation factor RRN3 [Xylona heveae TC161]
MVSITPSALRPLATVPPPVAKIVPPRPGLAGKIRKRDETEDMDLNGEFAAPNPIKRSKVAFDPDVEVRVLGAEWEKGLELVREEVRRALERHAVGDSSEYDRVKEIFTTARLSAGDDAPSPTTVKNYTIALLGNVSHLNRTCSGLVHAALGCDWLGRDESYLAIYVRFLGNLASAHGSYVRPILAMLVDSLGHVSPRSGSLPGYPVVRKPQLYTRAHMVLKYLLRLIPSASGALSPILSAAFPHSSDSKVAHVNYVRNLLRLIGYTPELQSEVLALITERLVKIDVQVQVDMQDLEEDIEEGLVDDVVARRERGLLEEEEDDEDDSEDEDDASSVSSEESLTDEEQRIKDLKENVEKMDSILDMLFSYYTPFFSGAPEDSDETFGLLLNHFTTIILPTYRSRHTQFLLFNFAQSSPLLIDQFAGVCMHLIFDKGRPAVFKQSAAAYLASFIARGAYVSPQVVRDVFDILGAHLDSFRIEYEGSCRGPDLRRYGTFYAMVQSLLYIFCFRWRDLVANADDYVDDDDFVDFEGRDIIWAPGVKEVFARAVYSKFNPLKVCSPPIVNEFARIANHLRFMYVFSLLETNKRIMLANHADSSASGASYNQPTRETALSARRDDSHHQLDAYFPFDPYNLPRSKRWVVDNYIEWQGVPGLDDGLDDCDSESEEEVDEEEVEEHDTQTDSASEY